MDTKKENIVMVGPNDIWYSSQLTIVRNKMSIDVHEFCHIIS